MLTLALACVSIGAVFLWKMTGRKYKLPPGPAGIPFIGNAFQLDKAAPFQTMTNWADEYGDVINYKMFGQNVVILSGYKNIYEALVTNATTFAGRPHMYRAAVLRKECDDVTFTSYSKEWAHRKKVSMQGLKMYGDNLENLELITLQQIDELLIEMRASSESGEAVEVKPMFYQCIAAIITSVVYGHKVNKEDIQNLLTVQKETMATLLPSGFGFLLDRAPILRFILRGTYGDLLKTRDMNVNWFDHELDERRIKYQPGKPECVIDTLFERQRKETEKAEGFHLSDDHIFGIGQNMIQAGTITSSLSLECLIPVLVNNPDIQDKMANIILHEIGTQEPRLVDKERLAYIEAAMLELLRYSTIIPFNLPHVTITDTQVDGYDIPKGTRVYFNLWKLHHDPKYWDEPYTFRPERFLEKDGSLVAPDHINRKRLLAFGASRRVCAGEVLAKNRLFLVVTSLLQHFRFLPVSEHARPNDDPRTYISGFGVSKPYKVRLQPRSH